MINEIIPKYQPGQVDYTKYYLIQQILFQKVREYESRSRIKNNRDVRGGI